MQTVKMRSPRACDRGSRRFWIIRPSEGPSDPSGTLNRNGCDQTHTRPCRDPTPVPLLAALTREPAGRGRGYPRAPGCLPEAFMRRPSQAPIVDLLSSAACDAETVGSR